MKQVEQFTNDYEWLSNFYPVLIWLDHISYGSVEHAYQAAKSLDAVYRDLIKSCQTANLAKQLGKKIRLRPNWDSIKLEIMFGLLRQKFSNPELKQKLLGTKGIELIEGNWWNDTYWGVCNGHGENKLGKLIMKVREELE